MKLTLPRTVAAAGAAALVLSLAACGGAKGPGSASETPEPGPLDAYFEKMYGSYSQEDGDAQQVRVEEILAECMSEQGFEYIPVDYSSMSGASFEPEDLEFEWGTKEFAAEYGYGATTDPWGNQSGEGGEEPADDDAEEFVDPNQDYVNAMSETEQQAYYAAMYGEQSFDETDPEAEVEYDWETAGCQGRAQHEVYEGANGMEEDEFTALQDEMNTMYESSMTDPRLADVNSEWASCMADAGYPGFSAVGDAENSIHDQVNALWEDAYPSDPTQMEGMTEEDYMAIQEGIDEQLADITPVEIETAVADFDCREKVGYDKVQREVSVEYQQEFVDAHKAELDAWLAASEEAKG